VKNIFTILTAILIGSTIYSQDWIEFTVSETTVPTYDLSKSLDTIVEFELLVPGMFSTAIDSFNRVQIKEHLKLDSVGYPEIPIVSYLVSIPECDSVNLEISMLDSIKIDDIFIYPAPELVLDTTHGGAIALIEQFAYNRTAYETDGWIPGIVSETVDKGAIRAQNVVRVLIYPVQFNPVKREAWVYSKANISLTFYNSSGSINDDVGIFNEVVGNTLINYNSNGLNASVNCGAGMYNAGSWKWATNFPNDAIMDTCDYLLITDEYFFNEQAAKVYIDSLARHRAEFNGFDVVMVKMIDIEDSINGINNKERIRNLIKNTYENGFANNTYDGKLAYVNLFGDVDLWNGQENIPTHYEDPDHGGYDVYFTQLTQQGGTYDIYPDLMIGRCSVDTVTQVQNVVHKILNFKPETLEWKDEMLTIYGEWVPQTVSTKLFEIDEIMGDDYDFTLIANQELYDYGIPAWDTSLSYSTSSIKSAWADGQMFVNYLGHGAPSFWGGPGFNFGNFDSTHNNILPFTIAGSCNTGKFQASSPEDCIAEQFLCNDSIKGSIAYIGASQLSYPGDLDVATECYHSVMNHAQVIGEAFMDSKIENSAWRNHYNLFSDPALNVFYENTDTVKPELFVKSTDITFNSVQNNIGDTVTINAILRNNSLTDVKQSFYMGWYLGNPDDPTSVLIDSVIVDSLDGYCLDTLSIDWITQGINPGYYNIYVSKDLHDSIAELNENNNISFSKIAIYNMLNGYPANISTTNNSYPVSFNINGNYSSEEIIVGQNILTINGDSIISFNEASESFTSVGNMINNDEYQVVLFEQGTYDSVKCFNDELLWTYPLSDNNHGPAIADIDNDGYEEIFFSNTYLDTSYNSHLKLVCLNADGTLRWTCEEFDSVPYQGFIDPKIVESFIPIIGSSYNENSKTIYLAREDGKFYSIKEVNPDSAHINNTVTINNCSNILSAPVASDIDKDGYLNILIHIKDTSNNNRLLILNTDSLNFEYNYQLIGGQYTDPIFSDINNNGFSEIIIFQNNSGIHIYNNELDSIIFISVPELSATKIVSADLNDDYKNDIVCYTNADFDEKIIKAFNVDGNKLLETPIFISNPEMWISDMDYDNEVELLCYKNNAIGIMDIPTAGSSIGWPGQQGNMRNTGVLLQPAYLVPEDTTYWYNTILLTDSLTVGSHSTLIIKPGTVIRADAESQLAVYGEIIAEGTINHPIIFRSDTMNAGSDYWQGIVLCNNSNASFKNVTISNAEFGLLYEDFNDQSLENCSFINNTVGVGAFSSSPIVKECYFTDNKKAIAVYSGGAPILTDLISNGEFKNAIIDNGTGIYISSGSVYLDEGYNDIYNQPAAGYYIQSLEERRLVAEHNYWGSTSLGAIMQRMTPASSIDIDPICYSSNTTYKSTLENVDELLKDAYYEMFEGNFAIAESIFKTIIAGDPLSNEAYLSITGLYHCYQAAGMSWANLETYYCNLYNDTSNVVDKKLLFGYMNLTKRALAKYSEAIANYESVILNNPTYNDSVFAVINIGNTYHEAGNYKSSLGSLSFLRPESDALHIENTIDLLLSLKTENKGQNYQLQANASISEIVPNPFVKQTTVKFFLSHDGSVTFQVFDGMGKVILRKELGENSRGEHQYVLDLSSVPPGTYFLALNLDGSDSDIEKVIVQ
jgi:tetratricopeptide (TPR) repeat protein